LQPVQLLHGMTEDPGTMPTGTITNDRELKMLRVIAIRLTGVRNALRQGIDIRCPIDRRLTGRDCHQCRQSEGKTSPIHSLFSCWSKHEPIQHKIYLLESR